MPTSHTLLKKHNSTSQCIKLQRLCTIVHCYCYWKAWRNVLSCQWGREIRKFGSNELMILFILPPLDWKMDVYSVNFSEERRTRSIDRLTLWLRANARSQRQRFHLLTVDFDPYQLDSSSRLTYSWSSSSIRLWNMVLMDPKLGRWDGSFSQHPLMISYNFELTNLGQDIR